MLTYGGSDLILTGYTFGFHVRYGFQKINFQVYVHKSCEHIERIYHPTWEIVRHGDVKFTEVTSIDNLVDPFTKAFQLQMDRMGVRCDIL